MVDQLLADQAPSDEEKSERKSRISTAQWKDETILPQFHVQDRLKGRRLTRQAKGGVIRWRSQQKGDTQVRPVEVDKQVEEKQECMVQDGNEQLGALLDDHPSSGSENEHST